MDLLTGIGSGRAAAGGLLLALALFVTGGCGGGAAAGGADPATPPPAAEGGERPSAARAASNRLVERGRRALEAGRPGEAASLLERAIRLDPSNGRAYLALAEVRESEGRPGPARGLLERAVDLLSDPAPGTEARIERLRRALGEEEDTGGGRAGG